MINQADVPVTQPISPVDFVDPVVEDKMRNGRMNVGEEAVLENVRHAIRLGYPQMRPYQGMHPEEIVLVGSGPSINDPEVFEELRQLIWKGAILVTVNGAYKWCIDHNLEPRTQVVMDARPSNARFVDPALPRCNYLIASQCHPNTWKAVEGRENVWIFHPVLHAEGPVSTLLDEYYMSQWHGVGGGTTVASRTLMMLRAAGYTRFHLFGVDCCWKEGEHHAMPQPENQGDRRTRVSMSIRGEEDKREFIVTSWMIKQFEDFLTLLHYNGKHFLLEVHGDGLLSHALRQLSRASLDDISLKDTGGEENGGSGMDSLQPSDP